ncbi:MAG: cytochrome d ubiquinol oxidase subunit II [Bacteroidetes bacterium]|nr:cytochrome d ubiquinol oxidase subunit II [Bacteroidota bacterium]
MKRFASLTFFLAILSVIVGYLLSSVTWIGRVGISLFYDQYQFLKVWWQAALVVFGLLLILYLLQSIIDKILTPFSAKLIHFILIISACIGLYFSYQDFRQNLSHRLLGERFHLGVYLFWFGWVCISIYFLLKKKNAKAQQQEVGMDM